MHRPLHAFFAFLLVVGPTGAIVSACKKDDPPPAPANLPSDEDDKPKKKKKASDSTDDPTPVSPTGDDSSDAGAGTIKLPTGVGGGGSGKKKDDKGLLFACCTALHNAAEAAGIAQTAADAIPGLPPPPPKDEIEKQAKACDKAVVSFTGDINESLKKVKGASTVKLPSACNLQG